jgi:hypothetical protein
MGKQCRGDMLWSCNEIRHVCLVDMRVVKYVP